MYKDNAVHYPQDEMNTALLPITLGCSYNKCAFCSMYKDEEYREVPISDIESQLVNMPLYTEKVFLTGADPISIGFVKMKRLLEAIKFHLPYCACVSSYASIKNLSSYSVEELSVLHNLGLRLLYIGFETGRDDILKLMKKGHSTKEAIKQAKKLNEAKLSFKSIIMYGIAGKGESIKNALATAEMLNQFTTEEIITMNLTIFAGTELSQMVKAGDFVPPDRSERLMEIRTLLENIQPSKPTVFNTTHPTNIIKIRGFLPEDRTSLLSELD